MSILYPFDPGNMSDAENILAALGHRYSIYLILMIGLFFLIQISNKKLSFVLSGLSILLAFLYLADGSFWDPPSRNYDMRTFSGLILFSILVIAALQYVNENGRFLKIFTSKNNVFLLQISSLSIFCR